MDLQNEVFGLQSPVLYAGLALTFTLAAVTIGYFYTKNLAQANVNKTKVKESKQTNAKTASQSNSASEASKDASALSKGPWPTEDKPEILPMPENIPENMKKILDMGFPGCPIFRRMGEASSQASAEKKEECKTETENAVYEDKPQILPMPENIPENMKKILDMGFPGCPIFRRMPQPGGSEGDVEAAGIQPSTLGALVSGLGAAQAAGETAAKSQESQGLPPRRELPCDLKKAIESLCPQTETRKSEDPGDEEGEDLTLDDKNILYAKALEKSLGTEALKDLATLSEVLKSPAAEEIMTRTCPRDVHCAKHCTCLYKINRGEERAGILDAKPVLMDHNLKDDNLNVDIHISEVLTGNKESPKVMPIPDDAPENIKKILEMGFPGCPLFRRGPAKIGGKKMTGDKKLAISDTGTNKTEKKEGEGDAKNKEPKRDPVEYCSHLQSEVKRTKQKVAIDKIEEKMSTEQRDEERKIQSEQLSAIFNLMQSQQEKFGIDSMDDIQSQMKLYA